MIDFLIDTTLLCKLSAQITISPEQPYMRVPAGAFLTLSSLGSFGSNLGCSPCEGKLFIRHFRERSLEPGSHANVTFQLVRFWFILVTLVMCRHLELLPLWLSLWFSPLFFLLTPSANRPVAVEATKELWRSSGVFQRPHCSLGPSSCCQMGEGFSF